MADPGPSRVVYLNHCINRVLSKTNQTHFVGWLEVKNYTNSTVITSESDLMLWANAIVLSYKEGYRFGATHITDEQGDILLSWEGTPPRDIIIAKLSN